MLAAQRTSFYPPTKTWGQFSNGDNEFIDGLFVALSAAFFSVFENFQWVPWGIFLYHIPSLFVNALLVSRCFKAI
jgi:hypothetical protein